MPTMDLYTSGSRRLQCLHHQATNAMTLQPKGSTSIVWPQLLIHTGSSKQLAKHARHTKNGKNLGSVRSQNSFRYPGPDHLNDSLPIHHGSHTLKNKQKTLPQCWQITELDEPKMGLAMVCVAFSEYSSKVSEIALILPAVLVKEKLMLVYPRCHQSMPGNLLRSWQ